MNGIEKKTPGSMMKRVGVFLQKNSVVVIFLFLSIAGFFVSGATPTFFIQEIVSRFARNAFLVLSLIIPVIAGVGLNFGIVIGAMAGQMAIISTVSWDYVGFPSFIISILVSTPLAVLFGYITGKILNKTKGNEMITSIILGYLANGVYQFIYLILIGGVIPFPKEEMLISGGVGILASLNFADNFKYSLDNLCITNLRVFMTGAMIILALYAIVRIVIDVISQRKNTFKGEKGSRNAIIKWSVLLVVAVAVGVFCNVYGPAMFTLDFVEVPVACLVAIALLCVFNKWFLKTKLGQNIRTVGQSQQVATVSGINVDRTRIIAIIISTVFAAWGQIIHLQNIGTMNVYSNHEEVGLLAVAAILVGGASVTKATNKQALIGVLLFHAMFAISPLAGSAMFEDAQIGEFFRVFIAYGVIFISLALNAAQKRRSLHGNGGKE